MTNNRLGLVWSVLIPGLYDFTFECIRFRNSQSGVVSAVHSVDWVRWS